MVLGLKPMGKLDTPRVQVLDRTKVLHGPRTQTYRETRHSNGQVLDRTKVLHGPRTQTYGKTRHSNGQVLDRTKVLHGPRTQTYGEPRFYMVLEPKPTGKLDTLAAKC